MSGAMVSSVSIPTPGCASRPRQQWQSQRAPAFRCLAKQLRAPRTCRNVIASAQASDDDEKRRAIEEAMKDPAVRARMEAMEEQLANPEVAAQMAEMQQVMANPEIMARMAELRDDPELKPLFDQIKEGGMGALQRVMSDPIFLKKVGEKLGDVDMGPPPQTTAARSAGPPPPPEINTLLDAARYGDTEAVEDFLAIGKDVNMADEQKRTSLHYAVAYAQMEVFEALLEAGADLERADAEANTPLHYAAGYGRKDFVKRLIAAGASGSAQNATLKTPLALVSDEPRNPLNEDAEILQLLQGAIAV